MGVNAYIFFFIFDQNRRPSSGNLCASYFLKKFFSHLPHGWRRPHPHCARFPQPRAGMKEVVSVNPSPPPQPQLIRAKQPGYLDLTAEQIDRLISKDPIEKDYDVETEPFARLDVNYILT